MSTKACQTRADFAGRVFVRGRGRRLPALSRRVLLDAVHDLRVPSTAAEVRFECGVYLLPVWRRLLLTERDGSHGDSRNAKTALHAATANE